MKGRWPAVSLAQGGWPNRRASRTGGLAEPAGQDPVQAGRRLAKRDRAQTLRSLRAAGVSAQEVIAGFGL